MKNLIMFFILVLVMVFSSYEVSYSQETGNFYFLIGTEGNERAIMYLHIEGERAYGSYYTESQSIYIIDGDGGFNGSFDGKNLNLTYRYYDNYYDSDISIEDGLIEGTIKEIEGTITGTLSGDIVFRGKHNSKNITLYLAKAPINNLKIFDYNYNIGENNYGDVNLSYSSRDIIHPRDYNERKLINDYNKTVNSDENEMHDIGDSYGG